MCGVWCWLLSGSSARAGAGAFRNGFSMQILSFFTAWCLGSKGRSPKGKRHKRKPWYSYDLASEVMNPKVIWRSCIWFVQRLPKGCLVSREGKITSLFDGGGEVIEEHVGWTIMLVSFLDNIIYHSKSLGGRKTNDLCSFFYKKNRNTNIMLSFYFTDNVAYTHRWRTLH